MKLLFIKLFLYISLSLYGAEQHFQLNLNEEERTLTPVGLLELPFELQIKILDNLGQKDLNRVAHVSRASNVLVAKYRDQVTSLNLSRESLISVYFIQKLGKLCPKARELLIINPSSAVSLTIDLACALTSFFSCLKFLTLKNVNMHWAEGHAIGILRSWKNAQSDRKLTLQINKQEPFVPVPESGFSFRDRLLMDPYANLYYREW